MRVRAWTKRIMIPRSALRFRLVQISVKNGRWHFSLNLAQETMTIKASRKICRQDRQGNKWRRWGLLIAAPAAPLRAVPLRKPVGDNFSSTAGRFSFRPRHARLAERLQLDERWLGQIFRRSVAVVIFQYVISYNASSTYMHIYYHALS